MSTTATPSKKAPPSASDQLAKLEQRREAAHVKAREAKARVEAFAAETQQARVDYTVALREHPEQASEGPNPHPLPGTELARMRDEVRKRMSGPNPAQPAYETARDAFHEVGEVYQQFQRASIGDRLAESDPALQAASDEIREGFAAIIRGAGRYQQIVSRAREIIIATPGLDGQDVSHDPRPNDWKRMAVDAVDSEILPAGLTPNAAAKVAA